MSDGPLYEAANTQYEQFRLLVRSIVQDHLSANELDTFHWTLKLPKKLLEESTPSIAIIRFLEERNILQDWTRNPSKLATLLADEILRNDLATRIHQWSLDQTSATLSKDARHEVQQEITEVLKDSIMLGSGKTGGPIQCHHDINLLRSVNDEQTQIRSTKVINKEASIDLVLSLKQANESRSRATSIASSGYFSERGSTRYSDISLMSSCAESWQAESQSEFSSPEQKDSRLIMSPEGRSLHPKHVLKVSQEKETQTMRPNSPVAIKKHGIGFEGGTKINKGCEESDQFRPRSGSLPGNARSIRTQVHSRVRKVSSTSSSNSVRSESPELIHGSCHSSQQSLSSGDQSSSEDGSGNSRGSQESVKSNSLRRMPVVCNTVISTKIRIPLKKISEDIVSKKNMARTSEPFPASKDVQYQLRFFSTNFANTACALYIDIARDYLQRLKKQSKKSSPIKVKIPEMDVTVTASISNLNPLRDTIISKSFEKVSAASVKLDNICEYLKGQQKYVTVTSFPNLLSMDVLDKYHHLGQSAEIIIHVDLDCFT